MKRLFVKVARGLDLLRLAAVANTGHLYWVLPFAIAVIWLAGNHLAATFNLQPTISAEDVQNKMLGGPLSLLAIVLGLRIIAGEINARTLEIVYTVPGGARQVWKVKLFAAIAVILVTQILLATYTRLVLTPFPIEALLGAFLSAMFFLVVSMGFSALFRSEVSGAIISAVIWMFFHLILHGFGEAQQQPLISPFYNPYASNVSEATNLLAKILQHRIGMTLLIVGIVCLAVLRGERREKLLSA